MLGTGLLSWGPASRFGLKRPSLLVLTQTHPWVCFAHISVNCSEQDSNLHPLLTEGILSPQCLPFHHPSRKTLIGDKSLLRKVVCYQDKKLLHSFIVGYPGVNAGGGRTERLIVLASPSPSFCGASLDSTGAGTDGSWDC